LGFKPSAAVEFFQADSYVGVRPVQNAAQSTQSGFGMIKAKVKQVPADFDVATLLLAKKKKAPKSKSKTTNKAA